MTEPTRYILTKNNALVNQLIKALDKSVWIPLALEITLHSVLAVLLLLRMLCSIEPVSFTRGGTLNEQLLLDAESAELVQWTDRCRYQTLGLQILSVLLTAVWSTKKNIFVSEYTF